jgi:hypothetical protein
VVVGFVVVPAPPVVDDPVGVVAEVDPAGVDA